MSNNSLFKPFSMGKLTLKNRIVMAPMTRNFRLITISLVTMWSTTTAVEQREVWG